MKGNNSILALLVIQFLCGCATINFSSDIDEKLTLTSGYPALERPVNIFISGTHNFNGRSNRVESSADKFKAEIDAIQTSQVFKNPNFLYRENSDESIKVAINFKTAWFSDGCYLGSCIVWPMEERASNRIEFKVFNSTGMLVFSIEDEIRGREKGTVFDFSKGFKPLRQIYSKGSVILIRRCLIKFQASEAFEKLRLSGK